MKKAILLFALVAAYNLGFAQSYSGGLGYFYGGYSGIETSTINQRFAQFGIPELASGGIAMGGGAFGIFNRIIIGGEGMGFSANTINATQQVDYDFSYGMLNIGYLVLTTKKTLFYPMAGIGAGGVFIRVRERIGTPDLNDILANPNRGVELQARSLMLNFSLNVTHFTFGRENRIGGMALGLSVGGYFSPMRADWTYLGTSLSNAPDTRLNGWFVTLKFGGGGIVAKTN
ncbi:MAG: hypothetical protein H0X62_03425 [Bacteroidetes bacterium]|nr:hypothetical protein [Bacteroidota bacterium]